MSNPIDIKNDNIYCELCNIEVKEDEIIQICRKCLYSKHFPELINVLLAVNNELEKLKEENKLLKEKLTVTI